MNEQVQKPLTEQKDESRIAPEIPKKQRFNPFSLFWGVLLVQIGMLITLHNFNIVRMEIANVIQLWPLLIIAAGISMLSLRGRIGVALTSVLLIIMLAFISLVAIGTVQIQSSIQNESSNVSIDKAAENIDNINLSIKTGAGNLTIDSKDLNGILQAKLASAHSTLRHTSSVNNDTQDISISTEGIKGWWQGEYKNDLSLTLNRTIPMNVKLETGASHIDADFSKTKLRQLDIDSGASDIDIKLGKESTRTDISIDIGMSSINFIIPQHSGVSMQIDSGMSSKNTTGLRDMGNGRYESENYSTATQKIDIQGDMGMASLDIEYY